VQVGADASVPCRSRSCGQVGADDCSWANSTSAPRRRWCEPSSKAGVRPAEQLTAEGGETDETGGCSRSKAPADVQADELTDL